MRLSEDTMQAPLFYRGRRLRRSAPIRTMIRDIHLRAQSGNATRTEQARLFSGRRKRQCKFGGERCVRKRNTVVCKKVQTVFRWLQTQHAAL